jgi:hypothetical protein
VSTRLLALAVSLLLAAGLAGCGLGAGASNTDARVLDTRDFGDHELGGRISQTVPSSETAMRLLERSFTVKTRFGGGFVQSIEGLAGGREGGRPVDWFFYVNGLESDKGAADADVHEGDRIWWDRHDWGATPHVPAVVGSFPEPFLHGSEGKRYPVVLECADDVDAACTTVSQQLADAGVIAGRQTPGTGTGEKTIRVLVGTWSEIGGDAALEQLDRGPVVSGVYAHFDDAGRSLVLLDQRGETARTFSRGAGLVMATRFEQQAPTWAITGTDAAGVTTAAHALDEQRLHSHFALAVGAPRDVPVPLVR